MVQCVDTESLDALVDSLVSASEEYNSAIGRSLPISTQLGQLFAAKIMGYDIVTGPGIGYQGIKRDDNGKDIRLNFMVKLTSSKRKSGPLNGLRLDREWDSVVIVMLSGDREVQSIYELSRSTIRELSTKQRRDLSKISVDEVAHMSDRWWCAAK